MITRLAGGPRGTVTVSLLPHSFSWKEGATVVVYDGEGRLFSLYENSCLYRRGLDSHVLKISRGGSLRPVRTHCVLSDPEAQSLFRHTFDLARQLYWNLSYESFDGNSPALKQEVLPALERVLSYTPDRLLNERRRFREVYQPIRVLPPDQYMALVVQIARGCSYNRCTFCNLYRDRPFAVASPGEVRRQIRLIRDLLGKALPMRKGVFLGDGNALSLSIRRLLALLKAVRSELTGSKPLQGGLYIFADVPAVLRKSPAELALLRREGIRRIYLGLESGCRELLAVVEKAGAPEQQLEAVTRLKSAGLSVGVIFLVGLGGHFFARYHVQDTMNLIRRLPLNAGDLIYFSKLCVIKNTPYWQDLQDLGMGILSEEEMQDQIDEIRTGIAGQLPAGIKTAIYDLTGFIY